MHTGTFDLNTLDVADLHRRDATFADAYITKIASFGAAWYGLPHGADAAALTHCATGLARASRPECVDRVQRAAEQAATLALHGARSLKPVWADQHVTGTRLNVSALLSGQPRAWGRFDRKPSVGNRTVALYIDCTGNSNVSGDALAWAPVAGLIVADMLESAGYRAEVWAVACSGYSGDRTTVRTLLKAPEHVVDLASLSRMAHAVFARAIMYPQLAQFSEGTLPSSYGHAATINPADFGDDNAVVISACYSLTNAVAEIKRVIAQFGGEP
jgi:hypothetical protein